MTISVICVRQSFGETIFVGECDNFSHIIQYYCCLDSLKDDEYKLVPFLPNILDPRELLEFNEDDIVFAGDASDKLIKLYREYWDN